MPNYDYYCESNGETVEVRHPIDVKLSTWGELCFVAQHPLGDTDPLASVRRLIRPAGLAFPIGNSALKNQGFTKLVKRDDGVYENVTVTGEEKRYMVAGDSSSVPHIKKKVED